MIGHNKNIAKTSALSDFVRNTAPSERNEIYRQAIKSAIESQQKTIQKSKQTGSLA